MTVYLVDTNVLLRFVQRSNPSHPLTRKVYRTLRQRGDSLSTTTQNRIEFWNVTTRPLSRNGFGFSVHEADRQLRFVERIFPILSPSIDKIELVREGRVRRAKLFYLRGKQGKAARVKEKKVVQEQA